MFSRLKNIWKKNGFEIVFISCIVLIAILAIYHKIKGKKGTWTRQVTFTIPYQTKKKKTPPKDSKGELECRRVLQQLFNKPFHKARPDFLSNPVTGGFNLELDCYDPQYGIAVEYNGIQHYKYVPYFHKNKEAFLNQKYRDDMKRRICKENGIILIEVPYTIRIENIRNFIINQLKVNGIDFVN